MLHRRSNLHGGERLLPHGRRMRDRLDINLLRGIGARLHGRYLLLRDPGMRESVLQRREHLCKRRDLDLLSHRTGMREYVLSCGGRL